MRHNIGAYTLICFEFQAFSSDYIAPPGPSAFGQCRPGLTEPFAGGHPLGPRSTTLVKNGTSPCSERNQVVGLRPPTER
jgi:hypothetical protein